MRSRARSYDTVHMPKGTLKSGLAGRATRAWAKLRIVGSVRTENPKGAKGVIDVRGYGASHWPPLLLSPIIQQYDADYDSFVLDELAIKVSKVSSARAFGGLLLLESRPRERARG
jgi:hypothetical protein